MVSAVNKCQRPALFAEIHLAIACFHVEVAIYKHCSLVESAPEGLLSVEVNAAVTIHGGTVHGVVGTFEMTVLVVRVLSTVQRVQVQSTDEAHVASHEPLAMYIANMCLCDGIAAFFTCERGVQRVIKVNITEVTHCEVFYPKRVAMNIKHGEIAYSSLCLSASRS